MPVSQIVDRTLGESAESTTRAEIGDQEPGNTSAINLDWPGIRRELGISQRESQIVEYILRNHKLSRIADEMGLSIGTVKTYLQRIHRKLGISGHVQLILKVVDAQFRLNARNNSTP